MQPEELVRRLLASLPQAGEGGSRVDFPPRFAGTETEAVDQAEQVGVLGRGDTVMHGRSRERIGWITWHRDDDALIAGR